MRRTILLAGVLPFVSAFFGGVLAFSLVVPRPVTAQASQPSEMLASAFILVGADGTVLARLAPGEGTGTGRLSLRDAAGVERITLNGGGGLNVFGQDGTTPVFRAGRTFGVGAASGLPQLNGVEIGPGGAISMMAPLP
jgi:hypothetical protein